MPWTSDLPIEAVVIANFLRKYGVDERAILIEGRSRNTHENAVEAGRILKDLGTPPVLLVTSAAHMPRAVASFRKAGIDVIPSPTDYHTSNEVEINILEILPSASALNASSEAIREWAGYGVYWWRDWL